MNELKFPLISALHMPALISQTASPCCYIACFTYASVDQSDS